MGTYGEFVRSEEAVAAGVATGDDGGGAAIAVGAHFDRGQREQVRVLAFVHVDAAALDEGVQGARTLGLGGSRRRRRCCCCGGM